MKKYLLSILAFSAFIGHSYAQNGWTKKASLPGDGRHHPACFTIGDSAYVSTGLSTSNGLGDFYVYHAATDTWTKKADHPGGIRGYGVGLAYKQKGYVAFGIGSGNVSLRDLWEFDQSTQQWTKKASLPPGQGRYHPAFVALKDKLYVGLGARSGSNLGDWWEYDIPSNTWTKKADFPGEDRHHPYYFAIGDYAYVGLGHGTDFSGSFPKNKIFKDWYRYDPSNNTWKKMNDLPSYGRVAGTCFDYKGKGYIMAGQDEAHLTPTNNEFWEYDPATDKWTQLPDCPSGGRWAPGAFVVGDILHFGYGEKLDNSYADDLWALDLKKQVSTREIVIKEGIKMYPNPVSDVLTLELNQQQLEQFSNLSVYNLSGQKVLDKSLNDNFMKVDLTSFNKGVYLFVLNANNGEVVSSRIVVN